MMLAYQNAHLCHTGMLDISVYAKNRNPDIATHGCSPAPDVLQDILTPMATVRVSFYEFLMILAKSETVNNSLGILPSRLKVFENNDTCNSFRIPAYHLHTSSGRFTKN
ncbi:Hypothetical predicted protein [Octopus vulgaris]|uniref:Uncharacterized protein n=1 Tax=Octopus vulgaris TaxID=6645 RepID=A0AA36B0A7_OCTVU|nr:Hypothetical predicted protein [Octopus vulgaris]